MGSLSQEGAGLKRGIVFLVAVGLFVSPALAKKSAKEVADPLVPVLDQLVEDHLSTPVDERIPKSVKGKFPQGEVELSEHTKFDFKERTAYGAWSSRVVNASAKAIADELFQLETIEQFELIKTLGDVDVEEVKNGFLTTMRIKTPKSADIWVNDFMTLTKSDGIYFFSWEQADKEGGLEWSRGVIVIEPLDGKTSVATVFGLHVLKKSAGGKLGNLSPGYANSVAAEFAPKHYAGFLEAMNRLNCVALLKKASGK